MLKKINFHHLFLPAGLFFLFAFFNGCSEHVKEIRRQVFVSVEPQAYFVKRIAGDSLLVSVLVPAGQSPATYEPNRKQLTLLAEADVYFRTGLPFEKQLLPKIKGVVDDLNIVDTRSGIELLKSQSAMHDGHDHGEFDPHVWLDPNLVKTQAKTICAELVRLNPGREDFYNSNLELFIHDLEQTDSVIREILAPHSGRNVYVFHSAYGYFTNAYGLNQVAVEIDGKEPGLKQMAELINQARDDNAHVIFVQPQFSQKTAMAVADEIKGRVVPLDPLSGDYLKNLVYIAQTIAGELESGQKLGVEF